MSDRDLSYRNFDELRNVGGLATLDEFPYHDVSDGTIRKATLTDIAAFVVGNSDHGALLGLADDGHLQYHNDARGDIRYFRKDQHLSVSVGVGSAGLPIVLDAGGLIDGSMIDDGDISHLNITDIGSNSHAAIDAHIASMGNPHSVTFTQAVAADIGTNITAAEAETLTDGSDVGALHNHDIANDARYVLEAGDTMTGNLTMSSAQVLIFDGGLTAPGLAGVGSTNSGLNILSSGLLEYVDQGVLQMNLSSALLQLLPPIQSLSTIQGSGIITSNRGSLTTPALRLSTDTNTGFYWPFVVGGDALAADCGGIEAMRWREVGGNITTTAHGILELEAGNQIQFRSDTQADGDLQVFSSAADILDVEGRSKVQMRILDTVVGTWNANGLGIGAIGTAPVADQGLLITMVVNTDTTSLARIENLGTADATLEFSLTPNGEKRTRIGNDQSNNGNFTIGDGPFSTGTNWMEIDRTSGRIINFAASEVRGAVVTTQATLALSNGANDDVALTDDRYFRITGITAAFNITGFAGGEDGREIIIYDPFAFGMTINNENVGSIPANRITTLTGGDLVTTTAGIIHLIYDNNSLRWTPVSGLQI